MAEKRRQALSIQEYEELVEAVCLYPYLYDKGKKEYKDKVVTVVNAWKEVVNQLSFIENGKNTYLKKYS